MEVISQNALIGGSYQGTVHGNETRLTDGILGRSLHTGQFGSSVRLDIPSDHCFVGNPTLCSKGFSLSFWINRKPICSRQTRYYYLSSDGGLNILSDTHELVQFTVRNDNSDYRLEVPVTEDRWQHVFLTWIKDSQKYRVYVNGYKHKNVSFEEEDGGDLWSSFGTSTMNADSAVYIGRQSDVDDDNFGEARIDEILFWDEYKEMRFAEAIFQFYAKPNRAVFASHALYKVVNGASLSFVSPIFSCFERLVSRTDPCRMRCMWLAWCGAVVYNGTTCNYYNIYNITLLTIKNKQTFMCSKV